MYTHQSKLVLNYKKKTNMYTNSTGSLTFDPVTKNAYSYKWWRFVAVVEGVVIFNNYSYSSSTSKHQYKMRSLLEQLGIKVDIYAPFSKGIPVGNLESVFQEAEENLCDLFLREESKKIRASENAKNRRETLKARQADRLLLVAQTSQEELQNA